jgi:hypothetical protein
MSASVLSDPKIVAALQQLLGSEAAEIQVPKEPETERRSIPKEWTVGWEIIRLLNSKRYDSEAVVISAEGAVVDDVFEDGSPVTFGDLATFVEGGAVSRKTGKPVND